MTPMASGAEGGSSTAAPVIGRCPLGGDLIENKTFVVGPDGPLARIMQEIRIRVDWGPEKMP